MNMMYHDFISDNGKLGESQGRKAAGLRHCYDSRASEEVTENEAVCLCIQLFFL